jgi:hypothetical protein
MSRKAFNLVKGECKNQLHLTKITPYPLTQSVQNILLPQKETRGAAA